MCATDESKTRKPQKCTVQRMTDSGLVSQQLVGLTQVDEMLIARVYSRTSVYRKHGRQRGVQGTCT